MAVGREFADPDGEKPSYDAGVAAAYRLAQSMSIEARLQRFSSRIASSSGFARTTAGLTLVYKWNAISKPLTEKTWKQLESSTWIADGSKKAPRVVYVFTDPNCPYCNKFWSDARPWVKADKVQLRHVMVGILGPTSPGKAAALLSAKVRLLP